MIDLDVVSSAPIQLPTFVDFIQSSVDLTSELGIGAAAEALVALACDPSLIVQALDANMDSLDSSGQASLSDQYTPDVSLLHYQKDFQVRLCCWVPGHQRSMSGLCLGQGIPYGLLHDHDFTILTAICLGDGYETDLWTYQASIDADGQLDLDDTRARFVGNKYVQPGRAYLYEKSRDVHSQLEPDDITVSVNLIVPGAARAWPQLEFDPATGKVRSFLSATEGTPERIDELYGLLVGRDGRQFRAG